VWAFCYSWLGDGSSGPHVASTDTVVGWSGWTLDWFNTPLALTQWGGEEYWFLVKKEVQASHVVSTYTNAGGREELITAQRVEEYASVRSPFDCCWHKWRWDHSFIYNVWLE